MKIYDEQTHCISIKWLWIMVIITSLLALNGCATVHTTDEYPDGRKTTTAAYEFGRTEMLTNLTDTTTKDGRSISASGYNADVNVKAINAGGLVIGDIVGAALKAYMGKP